MKTIITISRQYGSGGREIGRKLAEQLGVPFYDNEIISRAAKETGFSEAAFETVEDAVSDFFASKPKALESNLKALRGGYDYVKQYIK